MTTTADAERFLAHLARQWERMDPDSLPDLFHEDGRLLHSGMTDPIPREEIPDYFRARLAVVPDYSVRVDRWARSGEQLFVEWTFTGTIGDAEPPDFHGVHRFTLRGDRAVEAVAYYDTARMLALIQEAAARGQISSGEAAQLTAGQDALGRP